MKGLDITGQYISFKRGRFKSMGLRTALAF